MKPPEGYRLSARVEVRFGDVDMMGHVNHAKFFAYMEQARIAYFDEVIRLRRDVEDESIILADAACSYKAPLFHKDVVVVWVRVARLGSKSFQQEYVLMRESDGQRVATGKTVSVAFDYSARQAISLPDAWRTNIAAYEPALEEADVK